MGKLVEISCCYKCGKITTIDCRSHYCRHPIIVKKDLAKREITTNILKQIPKWCPLPDSHNLVTYQLYLSSQDADEENKGGCE